MDFSLRVPTGADLAKTLRGVLVAIESAPASCDAACDRREEAMPDSAIAETADFDVGSIVAGLRQSRDVLHNVRASQAGAAAAVARGHRRDARPAHRWRSSRPTTGSSAAPVTPDMIDDFVAGVPEAGAAGACRASARHAALRLGRGTVGRGAVTPSAVHHRRVRRTLAEIRGLLVSDLRAAYTGDPPRPATPRSYWSIPE